MTGASRGIGAAVAAMLEDEGAIVIDASRSSGIDVTKPNAVDLIRAQAPNGRVDILVNNAGTTNQRSLEQLTEADWNTHWQLHVIACLRLMNAFAPEMAQRSWGRIVNVSSSSGKRPGLSNPAYSVTKAAQLSLSRVFADTYTDRNVLVNSVAPGAVASDLWLAQGVGLADQTARSRGITREEVLESVAKKAPRGVLAAPDEIAAVIVFLCSERAANVSGAAWSVDGGLFQSII